MGTSRHAAIPIYHATAEMAAFPITSESALRLAITELAFDFAPAGRTAALWREAEREILGGFPAFSVDEAVALRDQVWFAGTPQDRLPKGMLLHRYVRQLAKSYLEIRGTHAVPTLPEERAGHGFI